jgi:hypothetical protein
MSGEPAPPSNYRAHRLPARPVVSMGISQTETASSFAASGDIVGLPGGRGAASRIYDTATAAAIPTRPRAGPR